jgi:hypothetical protein
VHLIVDLVRLLAGGSEVNGDAKAHLLGELKVELGRDSYERGCLLLHCVIRPVEASNERQAGLLPAEIRLSASTTAVSYLPVILKRLRL